MTAPVCPRCKAPAKSPKPPFECQNGHPFWLPNAGPQTRFVTSTCREVLYGGAAGGGKSAALVQIPTRWHRFGDFRALLLRRETTQLREILGHARRWYPRVDKGARGLTTSGGGAEWKWSSGASFLFAHCKDEADAFNYQGDEFQYVGFDELTHFTETQYLEIISRVRGPNPRLPRYVRATTNPGGDGHEWVFKRWGAWLDPEFKAPGLAPRLDAEGKKLPPLASGEVAWIVKIGEEEHYVTAARARELNAKAAEAADRGEVAPAALSRTFIAARLEDNPALLAADPAYAAQLNDLNPVRRKQLREGDWLIKPGKGLYFQRTWFQVVDHVPASSLRVRYWDRAGSTEDRSDWTVGIRGCAVGDEVYIDDLIRFRGTPGDVEKQLLDAAKTDGPQVWQVLEQDPGQAGKFEIVSYLTALAKAQRPAAARKPTGDKVTRAGPASAAAQAGRIKLLRAPWNTPFLSELEGFPEWEHDDQVDGLSGLYTQLMAMGAGSAGTKASTTTRSQEPSIG